MPKLSLTFRIFLALFLVWVPLSNFDQWLYDHLFRFKPKPQNPPDYVIVRVSDGKLTQLLQQEQTDFAEGPFPFEGGNHPVWHRFFYERLIKKLNDSQARLIVFTTFFDWVGTNASPPSSKVPIIFSSLIDDEGRIVPPSQRLTRDNNYGFNNLFLDSDNVFRKSPVVFSSGQSLALISRKTLSLPAYSSNLMEPINVFFQGPSGSFSSIDAWDLFDTPLDPLFLKNKVILVGREGSPAHDLETPVGKMSRVEIHANLLHTFLNEEQVRLLPSWPNYLIALSSVIISIAIILSFPLSLSWVLLLTVAGAFVALGFISLIGFHFWIGLASPLFCIFGTHLLLVGFKIGQQEEKQWRIQEESKLLKEMDQFKNNFVSLFSHDLKTPIAKIKAIIDRLYQENPQLPVAFQEGLNGIEKANAELSRLISDILRVTKMESMPVERSKEVVDINRLVESAIQRIRFLFEEKEIKLIQNLEPLFSMEGDPQLLLEVITNLLENAVKYSPRGSQIIIQTKEQEGRVSVHIIDEGPGIPEEELPRVTSKFYRGKSASQNTRGSGLGLYLAKYFVELHGGNLRIESKVGIGTHVSFALPIS